MHGSIQLGRVGGISISINYSWVIIFVLLAASLALGWFPFLLPGAGQAAYWVMAIIGTLLFFLSVLAHELAHSLVARGRGLPVSSITLFIFGGVSNLQQEPRSAAEEFVISVVGPVTSLVIGTIAWGIGLALGARVAAVAAVLVYLGYSNVLLGIFNLVPGFPLDGGRVLRSIIWAVTRNGALATRWAVRVGEVIAVLFILWGIWQFFTGNILGGIWIGFIGWFLLTSAQAAGGQQMMDTLLRDVSVAQVMDQHPTAVAANISLDQLVNEYLLPSGQRAVAVEQLEQLVGMVTLRDVHAWPREQWAHVPVSYVMVPFSRLHTVAPDAPLAEAMQRMAREDVNQLPVVVDGHLRGMLTRAGVMRYLEYRRSLRPVDITHHGLPRLPRAS